MVQRNIDLTTMTERARASASGRVSVASLPAVLRDSSSRDKRATLLGIQLIFARSAAASSLPLVLSGAKAHVSEFLVALCALARLLVVAPAARLRAR